MNVLKKPLLYFARIQVSNISRTFAVNSSLLQTPKPERNTESTVDAEEVKKFAEISQYWWHEGGEFQALHTLNLLRVPLIRDSLAKHAPVNEHQSPTQPLSGLKVLDVGCGGGLLSEPLARLGAAVTGLDASKENIDMACLHSSKDRKLDGKIDYECLLVEELALEKPEYFDGVVASEIVEHVADANVFIDACCDLVKPGGSLFLTTMNKTMLSYGLAVFAAENIFKVVPKGAHDWNKFISPEDVQSILKKNGFHTRLIHGMILNPLTMKWSWINDTSMNYAIHATKNDIISSSEPQSEEVAEE